MLNLQRCEQVLGWNMPRANGSENIGIEQKHLHSNSLKGKLKTSLEDIWELLSSTDWLQEKL